MHASKLSLAACLVLLVACQLQPEQTTSNDTPPGASPLTAVTSPALAVLPYDSVEYGHFLSGTATKLDAQELNRIEWLLLNCTNEYNQAERQRLQQLAPGKPVNAALLIALQNYNRQVVPVINKRGEKEVWVNCFCRGPRNWRNRFVRVHDGGNCYFNVRLNLTTNQWADLFVNGEA